MHLLKKKVTVTCKYHALMLVDAVLYIYHKLICCSNDSSGNKVYGILYLLPFFTEDDMSHVNKNLTKKRHNIWYEARLLPKDPESTDKAKRVYVYISPKVSWYVEIYLAKHILLLDCVQTSHINFSWREEEPNCFGHRVKGQIQLWLNLQENMPLYIIHNICHSGLLKVIIRNLMYRHKFKTHDVNIISKLSFLGRIVMLIIICTNQNIFVEWFLCFSNWHLRSIIWR